MKLIHRQQRAEARSIASKKYPMVVTPYLWGAGDPTEHWINRYSQHPKYDAQYLIELRIIRDKRFH